VLLVEDNKSTLLIMSRLLRQKLNFNVLAATCVADALTVLALPPFLMNTTDTHKQLTRHDNDDAGGGRGKGGV